MLDHEISIADDHMDDLFSSTSLAPFDTISTLLGQYNDTHAKINKIASFVSGEMQGAMHYFLTGNRGDTRDSLPAAERLFKASGAVAALNSAYWSKAMQLTDVLDMMPQARRDEWHKSIREYKCPPFEDKVVRDTLETLLASRATFLAERVDGIFRGLSGAHVTNQPQGFSKRMIIANVMTSFDTTDHSKCGLINDLRCVVAKFMRRGELNYNASSSLVASMKGNRGQWIQVDGGALKIRLYKVGTAHLEVHPDMAWRLNGILANLYPRAIPPQFRERPKHRAKDVRLIQRPLPFAVVEVLAEMEQAVRWEKTAAYAFNGKRSIEISNTVKFKYSSLDAGKHVLREAEGVLESLGGVETKDGWAFDYPPKLIIKEVVAYGCVPDQKAHQFYPTRQPVAEAAIALAEIGPKDSCLEPSAGLGGIAQYMPKDRTVCVEVAPLRVKVLKAKGYTAHCADFIEWATNYKGPLFDRVVMNPPFDQGRWRAHLEAAAALVRPGGRIVSVLPISAKDKDLLPGFVCSFPSTFDDSFAGTNISVVIMLGIRAR